MEHTIYTILVSIAFHTETSHLIYSANQNTGFCGKCNAGLKWVDQDNQTVEYASPIIEIKISLIFDNTNIQSADTQKHLGYIHHYKLDFY